MCAGGGIHEVGMMPEVEIGGVEKVHFDVGLAVSSSSAAWVCEWEFAVENR